MNYLITGSTGLIGKILVEELIKRAAGGRLTLILPVRDEKRARETFRDFMGKSGQNFVFVECDLIHMTPDRFPAGVKVERFLHCAAPTISSYMMSNPVETADSIVLGTRQALELARFYQVESMVYLSSMEVYGVVKDQGELRREEELGDIDLTSARSCYPLGKRMAEHYCHIYTREYGVPVKIARLCQVFGRGVRPEDRRVFMQFSRAVMEQKDIVLKTRGQSFGNYCSTEDAVRGILTILEEGVDGETYNVVNEANTMTIYEMAVLVAEKLAEGRIQVRIEEEDDRVTGYAPKTGLRMSAQKLRRLGWKPEKTLLEMYRDVVREMGKNNRGCLYRRK